MSEGPISGGDGLDQLPGGARAAVEAVLMVVDQPVTVMELATSLALPAERVQALLEELRADYDGYTEGDRDGVAGPLSGSNGWGPRDPGQHARSRHARSPRGFELRNLAGGWRIYSRAAFAPVVSDFVMEGQTARLTQAALETLAVIAYRQPVSRARVSAIRGVNVDSVVRTLVQRGLIEESGTDPESGAHLYRTTTYFLERLGVGSAAELPELSPHLPGLENLHDFDDFTY